MSSCPAPQHCVVGFQCSPQQPKASLCKPQGQEAARRSPPGLLSAEIQRSSIVSPHGLHTQLSDYSDEYETDDEFFLGDDGREESQGSSTDSSSSFGMATSAPINIPYKRWVVLWC